jgi:glycosyltransferase involved in cell wall biosynthesis
MKRGLIIIHEIHPKQGSECRSGYNYLKKILSNYSNNDYIQIDVVIPQTNLFGTSEYYLDLLNDLNELPLNIVIKPLKHVSVPFLTNFLFFIQKKRGGSGSPIIYYYLYKIWLKKIRKMAREINYDFIHLYNHINFFPIVDFSDVTNNWILGPVTGISDLPKSFTNNSKEIFRAFLQKCYLYRISRFCQNIQTVFAVSEADEAFFIKNNVKNVIRLPEQCFDRIPERINKSNDKLQIIWIGELVRRKQLEILIEASSLLDFPYEIHIVGDGPLKSHYVGMCENLNINSKFYGKINREDVFNLLTTSHVLVHTSYREGTATTILEAISMNNFVIAHKIGGQDLVIKSNGVLIDLVSFNNSVKIFRNELINLNNKLKNNDEYFNLDDSNFLTWDKLFSEISKFY